MERKGGKRSRKIIRKIKRERYTKSFERRYGMSRSEWVSFKRKNRESSEAYKIAEIASLALKRI